MNPAHAPAPAAAPAATRPLRLGRLSIWPPVVLAPMAGVTDATFRELCRGFGAGLYVSEMATARGIVEGWRRSVEISHFGRDERPRSIQLYGTDPHWVARAVAKLVAESAIDHIDLNFGCPARKITRQGGGAALPLRRLLYRAIVAAAVREAGAVPVTVKLRLGIDVGLLTFLEAGRIAEAEGAAAVTLHARTAAQLYSGAADWWQIAALKTAVRSIPVLGNGDVFEANDALRMLQQTGCDGVVIGRGCLGRPWLFRDLANVFAGQRPPPAPRLGEVCTVMLDHARLLVARRGEAVALPQFRKHVGWYVTGYAIPPDRRQALARVASLAELEQQLAVLDPDLAVEPAALRAARGKGGLPQRVSLPADWLARRDDPTPPAPAAELGISGG